MRYFTLILVFLLNFASFSFTQEIVSDYNNDFEFWIGEWNIKQKILNADGTRVELNATTTVEYILDKQAIEENWEGEVQFFWEGMEEPQKIKGYSLRYYDKKAKEWLIYWMDTRHPDLGLPFVGKFLRPGYGEFFKKYTLDDQDQLLRITFNKIDENTVEWTESISKDGNNWTDIWQMIMTRK